MSTLVICELPIPKLTVTDLNQRDPDNIDRPLSDFYFEEILKEENKLVVLHKVINIWYCFCRHSHSSSLQTYSSVFNTQNFNFIAFYLNKKRVMTI